MHILPGLTRYRRFAERGLDIIGDDKPRTRDALEGMRDYFAFLERQIPALILKFAEWRTGRGPTAKGDVGIVGDAPD